MNKGERKKKKKGKEKDQKKSTQRDETIKFEEVKNKMKQSYSMQMQRQCKL